MVKIWIAKINGGVRILTTDPELQLAKVEVVVASGVLVHTILTQAGPLARSLEGQQGDECYIEVQIGAE